MEDLKWCDRCGLNTEAVLEVLETGTHYAKLVCGECGKYHKFVAKPEADSTKYRRPKQHRELVTKYGRGYCELCLLGADDFDKGVTLEAHHLIEFQNGGSEERDNIWIVCTMCHRLIHWTRRYVGRNELPVTAE